MTVKCVEPRKCRKCDDDVADGFGGVDADVEDACTKT